MKITIFWFAWSWTSTIWKLLSQKLNIIFMSSWNIMRSWSDELWYSIYEFEDKVIKKDSSFDLKLDKKVWDFWKKNNNFIFESRLAWSFIPDSFKIYLYCDDDIRYERVQKREWLLLEDVKTKTKKREDELVERYNKIYPNIKFPPEKKEFDLFIDATNISPDDIIELILEKIN
jgi:cytidylate kinase